MNSLIQELQLYKQWVVRAADKIPLNPYTGRHASVTDPSTWSDYETAMRICASYPDYGLGFVLTEDDPYTVIDLDSVAFAKNPEETQKLHIQICDAFDSYSEKSPSKAGLHIWCKGNVVSAKSAARKVEVYSQGRYMTVTGDAYIDKAVQPRQTLLEQLVSDIHQRVMSEVNNFDAPQTQSDDAVIELCKKGSNGNGEMFTLLYSGQWKKLFTSQSEADLTFCNIVAFYSDNRQQVVRIFLNSALGNRPKAKRDEYLFHEKWGIVTKAFDRKGPLLDWSSLLTTFHAQNEQRQALQRMRSESVDAPEKDVFEKGSVVPFPSEYPPGLMGEIAQFIYNRAVNPSKEVAIAAAISYMAALCGRGWNTTTNSGLNQYMILLAPTSGGKEGAMSGMEAITFGVKELVPAVERFFGPSGLASPQGLIKELVEKPCIVSIVDEFGIWLQKMQHKYARTNDLELRKMVLEIYNRSGHKQVLRGSVYSDRAKNVPNIESPAYSILGISTPQEFWKAVDEANVTDGLLPRFTLINTSNEMPLYNPGAGAVKPSAELIQRVATIARESLQIEAIKQPIVVTETPEATAFHLAFESKCKKAAWGDRENPIHAMATRSHLRLLRLAALIAVGISHRTPVITLQVMEWAFQLIMHGTTTLQDRFERGEVGESSSFQEQRKLIAKKLKEYVALGFRDSYQKNYSISQEMYSAGIVTHRFLLTQTASYACFRNDRNASNAFRIMIEELKKSGILSEFDMAKVVNSGKHGTAYYITGEV